MNGFEGTTIGLLSRHEFLACCDQSLNNSGLLIRSLVDEGIMLSKELMVIKVISQHLILLVLVLLTAGVNP